MEHILSSPFPKVHIPDHLTVTDFVFLEFKKCGDQKAMVGSVWTVEGKQELCNDWAYSVALSLIQVTAAYLNMLLKVGHS